MEQSVKQLNTQDLHHLRAAEGWKELGNLVEACNELEEISPEARAHPIVLSMRYKIYAKAGRWDLAAAVAEGLTNMLPDKAENWLSLAHATRRKKDSGIPEAKRILLVGQVKFAGDWHFPFNLACYCSQLGEFEDAKKWFQKAMILNKKTVQKLGVEDEDLKPLWASMSGTIWKRE